MFKLNYGHLVKKKITFYLDNEETEMNPGAVQPQYPTISNLLTNQEGCKCSNVHKWGSTVLSKHHS